jgi:cytoskeletal protein CcmA (bactofilin family)
MWNWGNDSKKKNEWKNGDPLKVKLQVKNKIEHNTYNMGETAVIGQSIKFKGELSGQEDIIIEGAVVGTIELKDNHLTIGTNGTIKADINAQRVTVIGSIEGNVTAVEKVQIMETGRLSGDITTPSLVIMDGAFFNGNVQMVEEKESNVVHGKSFKNKDQVAPEVEEV